MNNENYVILYGEKDLLKTDFAESLCVYLYERKIISNYEIFKIYNEFDFEYMKNKLRENIKKNNIRKNVKIIKFNFDIEIDNYTKSFDYLYDIYNEFCFMNNNDYYFIFIFDTKDNNINNIKDNMNKDMIKIDNILYLGINVHSAIKLLNHLIKGKNITVPEGKAATFLENIVKNRQKKIKLVSELLINGETFENIQKMENLEITYIKLNKDYPSFPLYYLLYNMPLGLPDSFLQLIFVNYKEINDDNNLIIQKITSNWNIINNEKRIEENFKGNKYMDKCSIYIFKALKLYTELLIYFIDKNRDKIIYKNGNIHYLFNSYSNRNIWKSKINNSIESLIGDKIYNPDYKLENHKQNILNIISIVINNIEFFIQLKEWSNDYLEEILLLFPSFFFLHKDNIELLQICIEFCKKLIIKTNEENLNKREENLKQKLLLFLYSLNKEKNEIININHIIDKDLELEIKFLEELRNKDKTINNFEKLLTNASDELKFYIYKEISIIFFKNNNYNGCMEILQKILNFNFIHDIYKNRIILDYLCVFILKMKKDNIENDKININENYKLIKNKIVELDEIIKRPYQKDIYRDAINLKNKIYEQLLEPDIIMLNSNPIKNNIYSLNNQYVILNKLKKDINEHVRLKSYVLNYENLSKALNEKGEILIIQSDDFTDNGEIVCETKDGESKLLQMNNLLNILKNKRIDYKVLILCFLNSYKIKENFNNFPYVISFEHFNNLNHKQNILKELNKASIEFIIDFIKNIANNKVNNEIKNIFDLSKKRFFDNIKSLKNEINCKDLIVLNNNKNIDLNIRYSKEIEDNQLFLYDPLIKFNNINIKEEENINDYISKINKIIERIEKENKMIYYCDESNKNKYLKFCFEVMKFYFRHKTYKELFCIDIKGGDKTLLQSIIRKLNEFKIIDNEEENDENIQQKNCFLLIYNCYWLDLLDINIFSLLNNNSSYIIIYDNENYKYYEKFENISEIFNRVQKEMNEKVSNISPNDYLNNKEILPNIERISKNFDSTFGEIKKDGTDKKVDILKTLQKEEDNLNYIKELPDEMNTLFDEVKNIERSKYLSFENEEKDEEENVCPSSKDFEIIQLLVKRGFEKVFKVISKLNNKVYAMKV